MTLYNYRSDGTVTKWDHDGNIESQYLVAEDACTCPAGHRHTCRHRQMLPHLLPIADTHWFLDWGPAPMVVDFNGMLKSNLDALAALDTPAINVAIEPKHISPVVAPATQPAWRRL